MRRIRVWSVRRSSFLLALAWLAAAWLTPGPSGATVEGDAPVYRIGPASAWVEALEADYAAPVPAWDEGQSTHHVLVDSQVDVRERGEERYERYAIRLVNDAGAEEYTQLSLRVDPGFETLKIHSLRVYRDGRLEDRLRAARITVLPVEQDLQSRVYRGEFTVNLLIPDLRAGDVLDYAYSKDSINPNFPRHYADTFSLAWSEPVHRHRVLVRHFIEDPVTYRVHGGPVEPVVRTAGNRRVVEFDLRDQPSRPGESDIPDWHPHWAYVEFSDMASWGDVAGPTAEMYGQMAEGTRWRAEAAKLAGLPGDAEGRILAALRMVQDDIRYASISIGPGSYRPHGPDAVLERSFGDCKDKSLLLVTLLRALDIDASVALVNTQTGHALGKALPTPYAFDHAIVRVRHGGRTWWLDPTATEQRGTLANTAQADFISALVVDPGVRELEAMPRSAPDAWSRDVRLQFDLSAGVEKPARLDVESRYAGGAADWFRGQLTGTSMAQRTKNYLNYYAEYYPGIQVDAPVAVKDDPVANVILVRERYRMARGFRPRDKTGLVLELFPDDLYAYAEGPGTSIRTAPIEQAFPAKESYSFEVRLPEYWPVRNSRLAIDNPSFRYASTIRYAKQVLNLEYRFESLKDEVPIGEVPQYLADLQRMYDDLGYELTYGSTAGQLASGIAPYPFVAALLGLLAGLWLAFWKTLRYDPEPKRPVDAATAPVGLGGWLVLVALNVIVCLVGMLAIVFALMTISTVDTWTALPDVAQDPVAPFAQHGVAALQFAAFLLLPSVAIIVVEFFRKRSSAPRLVIAMLWTLAVFGVLVEQLSLRLAPMDEGEASTSMLASAADFVIILVWTRYLQVSRRVAATFVRRREPASIASGSTAVEAVP